ncbi:1,4-dihydroxy-2-naphthoate octaprenyltransferase [Aquimarina brevivitae]|uniref:1,4-dihydroxy-2-naphthoate octaprenyltransferase n=1 Tax=Aquimarina brevivitae TaxID=323412 RepID=A0A4V2F5T2_9FLAO|nr:1,4-dihydroxy-2-naphthoate octaprenyltransferase [Aquimarina brevivitae]RZS93909.1 1,4-dihydroxy-2-naphthoate prenyltransferase [Aquimarina brevivitae]
MSKFKAWIAAARLRTLPLSVSGIIVGSSLYNNPVVYPYLKLEDLVFNLSARVPFYKTTLFWLAILTTLGLQILSNFANDYGDGVKGTDNEDRVGPMRAIQSGALTDRAMKRGIIITAVLTLVVAIVLIYTAFGKDNFGYSLLFFVLGIASIIAAIKYTVGNSAYGYRGLGDVFVFIFFGLVSVVGCFFLYTKQLSALVFLPAVSIGLLSTAVLNLNNMRDYHSDKKAAKNTLVVKLGLAKAKIYHLSIILIAMSSMLLFLGLTYQRISDLLFLLAYIPLAFHLKKVYTTKNAALLDPELKKVALSTFLLAILFSLGQIL